MLYLIADYGDDTSVIIRCNAVVVNCLPLLEQWDTPPGQAGARAYHAMGWNRPPSLPQLDHKFNAKRAIQEARERIRDQHKKVGAVWMGGIWEK